MDRRVRVAVAVAVVLCSRAATALADTGVETVVTKDGAEYRGDLVESVPGDHLTLKLATGDVKRFAWADVTNVTHDPPVPPAQPDKPAKKPDDGKKDDDAKPPQVHLVVDGEEGVLLERRQ